MERLADQFDECRQLRRAAALKMLPRYPTFTLVTVERWPMTWQSRRGCPVYIYQRLPCYPICRTLLEEPWASMHRSQDSDASADAKIMLALSSIALQNTVSVLLCSLLPLLNTHSDART